MPAAHFSCDSFTTHCLKNYLLSIHNWFENDLLSIRNHLVNDLRKKKKSFPSERESSLAPAFLAVTGNLNHRVLGLDTI